MTTPTIFGREPAVLAGLLEATLALLISFGALAGIGLRGPDELALVMAVVSAALGIYLAAVTDQPLLGVVLGAVKAILALAAVYGLTLTVEQTGALIAFTTVAIGLFQRTQVTPTPMPAGARGATTVQHTAAVVVILTMFLLALAAAPLLR